jgi:aminopeptidase N
VPSDTTNMKNAFINLENAFDAFEDKFGPYLWDKVGFVLVPFNGGAMEHATNIAYPKAAITGGSTLYEAELMSHELSHHWFGDLVTCSTAEDMWLNEGWASFSAFIFTESLYGKEAYKNELRTNQAKILQFAHVKEGGYRAVSGIPHEWTYGDHVYKKGADVAHTLRGFMGDSAFFDATKYTMINYNNKSINSVEFKNSLQTSSGQNLNDFFTNWVFSGGWPHFSIDSLKYVASSLSSFNAIVSLKQKLFGCNTLYTNVPLEISFFKSDWSRVVKKVLLSGAGNTFTINIPFMPIYAALNYDSKINDASSHEVKTIKNSGNVSWNLGKLFMQVQNKGQDSSLIRVIHNYVKPDPFSSNPINQILSNQRYWKIEGILSLGFVSKAKFYYDGNKTLGGTYSYLDTMLTKVNGDSITLFYRKSAKENWSWLNNSTKFISGIKTGFIEIDSLKLGEYSFGTIGDTAALFINKKLTSYIRQNNL